MGEGCEQCDIKVRLQQRWERDAARRCRARGSESSEAKQARLQEIEEGEGSCSQAPQSTELK